MPVPTRTELLKMIQELKDDLAQQNEMFVIADEVLDIVAEEQERTEERMAERAYAQVREEVQIQLQTFRETVTRLMREHLEQNPPVATPAQEQEGITPPDPYQVAGNMHRWQARYFTPPIVWANLNEAALIPPDVAVEINEE